MGVATLVLCPCANSWPHTSACVTGLQPVHPRIGALMSHQASGHTMGPTGLIVLCPAVPPIASTAQSDYVLHCHVHFLRIPPTRPAPSCCLPGLFSAFCDPTSLLICPLASHLQRLRSSRYSIPTQHSFQLTRQSTCASIALSILRRTTFLHRSSGQLRLGKATKGVAPVPSSETKCYAPASAMRRRPIL